ncbi:MAG TPA: hypothetical protein VMU28_13285 [Terriglobales bacterium]|nr:hypothetical protein [Terriglobales bacterium]
MSEQQNFLRRGVHSLIYGLCAVVIGITPPAEKYEVPFLLGILGFLVLTAGAMYLVATYVANAMG